MWSDAVWKQKINRFLSEKSKESLNIRCVSLRFVFGLDIYIHIYWIDILNDTEICLTIASNKKKLCAYLEKACSI